MDDISKLVDMTFEDCEKAIRPDESLHIDAETSGVLFSLYHNNQVFVIRAIACENLQNSYKDVMSYPENFPKLRLLDEVESEPKKLFYFETDSYKLAKTLVEKVSHKRFPLHEERIFNVSDPMSSWWLAKSNDRLKIYMNTHYFDEFEDIVKMGHIDDVKEALFKFSRFRGFFDLLFDLDSYKCDDSIIEIVPKDKNDPYFILFKNLFDDGESDHDLWLRLLELERNAATTEISESIQFASFYLMEISMMRRFWAYTQDLIQN